MASDTIKSLQEKLRLEAEFLAQTRAEVRELVKALRKNGQHFGCRLGHGVPKGQPVLGVNMDGSPANGAKHGCTCGLRLLLARYGSVK